MSFFLAVNKTNDERLEIGVRQPDLIGIVLDEFRTALCKNHKLKDEELSILILNEESKDAQEALNGAEYNLIKDESGNVIGLDFTPETSKWILKVNATKLTILADGQDVTTITMEVWKPDDSGIATGINVSRDVPIITPDGPRKVRVTFNKGTASRDFVTKKAGLWIIPNSRRITGAVRVGESVSIESIQRFEDL